MATVAWLNFDHKKWLRKIKFPLMNFFSWKTTNEIFMLLLALSFCKILKKFLELIQSYENVPFSVPQMANLSCFFFFFFFFFGTNHYYYIYLPIGPFHSIKFYKISYSRSKVMSPKWPIYPNQNFFRKPVDKPCSFHSRLHTSQKSKWDINLLMKYWWLMNTEISLAEHHFWLTGEPDFSQACSFHRTLMSHKNFCFTQIPDKTNDVIFWKSLIFLFLGYFWLFLSDGDFFQKIWNCHERLYMGS